ncbi:hypothetical protein OV450_3388 [Actinobacteria bacterium OV450]|nr:hypothetical protein OV450_3388 [Actinobacteria bacterium OV450]
MRMPEVNWDGLEEGASEVDELAKVKAERDRIARQLYDTKHRQADYLQTVWDAASDAVERIQIAPVPAPVSTQRYAIEDEEYCVALLSDLQTGKLTPDYNSTVARERVMLYARKIVQLADIQRLHHPVRHCVVPMLGDMVEGVDIFPGQQWLIDSTLYDQLFNTTPALLADFLRYLLAHFETVTAYCVDGNHGRIGRRGQFGPSDNADRMLYRIVAMLLRDEPRFELHMTDPQGERNWYQIMELGNYSALLIHGDQIRGSMGYPFYGLGKKVHSWGSGGLGRGVDFQDIMLGHYHQLARIPLNHRTAWANGSTESTNTFAAETLAGQSEPSQWLLFCDPDKGRITASYGVDLREEN